jgi:8-oxo-dGTP pyrophosphatase MutT (NUDIX family)
MPRDESQPQRLLELIEAHARAHPHRRDTAACFAGFIHAHPWCCRRELAVGHLTGSAWLVDRAGGRVLLTHHRKLGRWLQLGGHADGDPDLAGVALREAAEESGLAGLVVEPDVFDLDRHWIPERGGEPGHWHYDVRFVVRATVSEDFVVSGESHALAWRPVREVLACEGYDGSLRRMAAAWLARGAP